MMGACESEEAMERKYQKYKRFSLIALVFKSAQFFKRPKSWTLVNAITITPL